MELPHPDIVRAGQPHRWVRVEEAADLLRICVSTFYKRLRRDPSFPQPVYLDDTRRKWWSNTALASWARRQYLFEDAEVQRIAVALYKANFDGTRDPFICAFMLAGGTLDELAALSGIHTYSLSPPYRGMWRPRAIAALYWSAAYQVLTREMDLRDKIDMGEEPGLQELDDLNEAHRLVYGQTLISYLMAQEGGG